MCWVSFGLLIVPAGRPRVHVSFLAALTSFSALSFVDYSLPGFFLAPDNVSLHFCTQDLLISKLKVSLSFSGYRGLRERRCSGSLESWPRPYEGLLLLAPMAFCVHVVHTICVGTHMHINLKLILKNLRG